MNSRELLSRRNDEKVRWMWCVQRRGEEKEGKEAKKREEGYERKEKAGDD